MKRVTLGKTGIQVNFNGFGALPVQRVGMEEACTILQKAYQNGIDFYDTARVYSDSEEKLGQALSSVRENIIIATKTMSQTVEGFWADLETSLGLLKTDYIDIYQFHNPPFCPKPGDGSGLYEAMQQAKEQGKIRHIGITNHRMKVAVEAVESGLYETLQFPFSYLADEQDLKLVRLCEEKQVGFICMKALAGGLINNAAAAYSYLAQFDQLVPIWGIQKEQELDEFLRYQQEAPVVDEARRAFWKSEQTSLAGEFCRGCGYCLPCPAEIDIPTCARMALLLRRSPTAGHVSEAGKEKMERIRDCIHCNHCVKHCPYGLDTPALLQRNLQDYEAFTAALETK